MVVLLEKDERRVGNRDIARERDRCCNDDKREIKVARVTLIHVFLDPS